MCASVVAVPARVSIGVLSPQLTVIDATVPSGSATVMVSVIGVPVGAVVRVSVNETVGNWLIMVLVAVADAVRLLLSVTVTVTLNDPRLL